MGYHISAEGIRPTGEKVQAVLEAPPPQDVPQLRSFLGLVNYYAKFLRNLSTMLAPLYSLLQKNTPWLWGVDQTTAFESAKSQLTSSCLLVHFDPDKELILACDASPYGVGAVLYTKWMTTLKNLSLLPLAHWLQQRRSMHTWTRKPWPSCLE